MVTTSPARIRAPSAVLIPSSSITRSSAPTTAGMPHPRATTAAWLTSPPLSREHPDRGRHPGDVLRAGLGAHEYDVVLGVERFVGGQYDAPARATRGRAEPVPDRSSRSSPRIDPRKRFLARLGTHLGGDPSRASSGRNATSGSSTRSAAIRTAATAPRLPTRVWSSHSRPFLDRELHVADVAVVDLEPAQHAQRSS